MKKFLLSILTLAIFGLGNHLQAQTGGTGACGIKNVFVDIDESSKTPIDTDGNGSLDGCAVQFDLAFDFQLNNGNKYTYIMVWVDGTYPGYFDCSKGGSTKYPSLAQLRAGGGAGPLPFIVLGFQNNSFSLVELGKYADTDLKTNEAVLDLAPTDLDGDGYYTIRYTGVQVFGPVPCEEGIKVHADLFSSQSSNIVGGTVHCWVCDQLFAFNYPEISGTVSCTVPQTFSFDVTNSNTNQDITVTGWKAYADDGDGILELGIDPEIDSESGLSDDLCPTSAGDPSCNSKLYTGDVPAIHSGKNIIIAVSTNIEGTPNASATLQVLTNTCGTLPVHFGSFNANRNNEVVNLTWTTSSETNNKEFVVERMLPGKGWMQIATVATKAENGNSSAKLSYDFTDFQNVKGIVQYRIRQVDIDGRSGVSNIRSVRGLGQAGQIIVYPNPSSDGRVNISFTETTDTRDVAIFDGSGRAIRQWKGLVSNSLKIDNLAPGFYSVSVIVRETGERSVQKFVVNR